MIALIGFVTITAIVVLIMEKIMDPVPALILVPVAAAVVAGFGWQTGDFVLKGMIMVAPVGVMLMFATLFFGAIVDTGAIKPLIHLIIRVVGTDPVKICVGTGILAMIAHLGASGAVTFLIIVPAMLPIFDALSMRRTTLATIVALSSGVINTEPWAGPAQRCMISLNLTQSELWFPLVFPLIIGAISILAVDSYLGLQERKFMNKEGLAMTSFQFLDTATAEEKRLERPRLNAVNLIAVAITIGILISGKISPAVTFMIATAVALLINFPDVDDQKKIISRHSKESLLMSCIVFATGSLVGVMNETGMIQAMAQAIVAVVPTSLGQHMALLVGILATPASLLFDPSSFYFGVLPVLAQAGTTYGVSIAETARAALLGEMTMGFSISPLTGSTFLLVALAGIDLGEHQKKTFPWAFGITLIMLAVSIAIGVVAA